MWREQESFSFAGNQAAALSPTAPQQWSSGPWAEREFEATLNQFKRADRLSSNGFGLTTGALTSRQIVPV